MADKPSPAYVAHYGWDRRTVGTLVLCLVFVVLLVLVPDLSMFVRVLGLLLFGVGGLFMAYNSLSRQVAFRVDEKGVVLGGNPARYAATTAHVPWADITGFVLWQQHAGHAKLTYLGVTRRDGAPPLPGDTPTARAVTGSLVPVSGEVAVASRPVNGWRLDEGQLVAAVGYFAPGTPIEDQRGSGLRRLDQG